MRAAARTSQPVGIFAESSTSMFYLTRALGRLGLSLYCRSSTHYGSMGHAIGGAIGFCSATGRRAIVVTGDGSFDFMNPLRTAVKHDLLLTMLVLNDSRLTLSWLGSGQLGAYGAQATTQLEPWDFTRQGSATITARRIDELADLDNALVEALASDTCNVIDVQIDPAILPPVGARLESVGALFGQTTTRDPVGTRLQRAGTLLGETITQDLDAELEVSSALDVERPWPAPARPAAAPSAGVSPLTGRALPSWTVVEAARERNLRRGFAERKQLLSDALSVREVADLLDVGRQTPHDRRIAGTLLGVKDRGGWRFPAWQFDADGPDGLVEGLPEALKALRGPISDLGRVRWLVTPKSALEDRTPIDALRSGDVEDVIAAAQALGAS